MFANLIAVSYCGGSRGNAVARTIGFSPDVHSPWPTSPRDASIDHNGSVSIFSRLRDQRYGLPHDVVSVHDRLGLGMYHRDRCLPPIVAETYADAYQHLVLDEDGSNLLDLLRHGRAIFADHADPLHNLELYPGSTVVAVRCDWTLALRNFKVKWLDSPSFDDATTTNMDAEIMANGMMPSRENHKSRLRSHARQLVLGNRDRGNADVVVSVDSDRLFSAGTAEDEYHQLMRALKLAPAWHDAGPWIGEYIRRGWRR